MDIANIDNSRSASAPATSTSRYIWAATEDI